MKNKITIKLLALLLALAAMLCGCKKETDNSGDTQTTQVTTTVAETVDTAYENIPRFDSDNMETVEFSFMKDPYSLVLNIPSEWELSTNNGGYSICRGGEKIGRIFSGEAEDASEWTVVKSEESADGGLLTGMQIERRGSGDNAEYRYRFCYSYAFGTIQRMATLTVGVSEVDDFVEKKLTLGGRVVKLTTDSGIGILNDGNKQITNIAILGNSFVGSGSSNIGAITREMFNRNGKACNVDAVSRGMANISTFTGDAEMMQRIRSGSYDIVFMCGLYSTSQVNELYTLKAACAQSNTTLVVFPAHNESASAINQAKSTFPDLVFLDWKNEIDQLMINKNISRSDFCINDYHSHSTPLAGYVGAHMIYRAIYSAVPTVGLSSSISQSYVDSLLGDYVSTGTIALSFKGNIKYFE